MKLDKQIIILIIIIIALCIGIAYELYAHQSTKTEVKNITINNTTVKNETVTPSTQSSESSESSVSGKYGYCAICGKALTQAEANDEYTQGKVCHSCAVNPSYQSGEGAKYANEKLAEAYPDEYEWMHEDSNSYN